MINQMPSLRCRPTALFSLSEYAAVVMGGKGALIQNDKSGTLSCNNDQTLIIINDQGGAVMSIEKADIAPTLRSESHQHEPIICIDLGGGKTSVNISEEKSPTLATTHGGSPVICFDPKALSDSKCATSIMGENAKDNPCVCYCLDKYNQQIELEKSGTLKRCQGG